MEWGEQIEKHSKNAKLSLYQNSNYTFERKERKTLIIDSVNNDLTSDQGIFTTELTEPLIIDKLSDVYLESFTTNNCSNNTASENMCFLLDIEQFNINSNSAFNASRNSSGNIISTTGTYSFNHIVIPNECNSSKSIGTFIHKSKKLNYICSINPTRISNINGKITNLDNKPIITDGGRFILELVIVARDKD
jgi:hypothetical protein